MDHKPCAHCQPKISTRSIFLLSQMSIICSPAHLLLNVCWVRQLSTLSSQCSRLAPPGVFKLQYPLMFKRSLNMVQHFFFFLRKSGAQREGSGGGGGWKDGGRHIVRQKLPMLASQCGYVMRARDTDTHTHTCRHTHTLADTHLGLSLAPRLISGTQRPQTEVAEDTQWEQGLKAWFTSALKGAGSGGGGVWDCEWEREW